jgi:hypothetical protein
LPCQAEASRPAKNQPAARSREAFVTPWIGVGYLFGVTRSEADEKSFA